MHSIWNYSWSRRLKDKRNAKINSDKYLAARMVIMLLVLLYYMTPSHLLLEVVLMWLQTCRCCVVMQILSLLLMTYGSSAITDACTQTNTCLFIFISLTMVRKKYFISLSSCCFFVIQCLLLILHWPVMQYTHHGNDITECGHNGWSLSPVCLILECDWVSTECSWAARQEGP